jgi:hypothetical protein
MDNPQASVTDLEMGWLLGILDGEGHVGLANHQSSKIFQPTIKFVNTNVNVIDKLVVVLNKMGQAHMIYDAYRQSNQRPAKRVEINGMLRVQNFLDHIYKYDFAKKREVLALRSFIDLRLGKKKGEPMGPRELELAEIVRAATRR